MFHDDSLILWIVFALVFFAYNCFFGSFKTLFYKTFIKSASTIAETTSVSFQVYATVGFSSET